MFHPLAAAPTHRLHLLLSGVKNRPPTPPDSAMIVESGLPPLFDFMFAREPWTDRTDVLGAL